MKIYDLLVLILILGLTITVLNYCLPQYNRLLEGMCSNIGMCDFKPLSEREEKKLYASPNKISSKNESTFSQMSLDPDIIDPDSTPEWPEQCDASYSEVSGEYVIFDNKLDHKKFEKEKDKNKLSLNPEQEENIVASEGETLPQNYLTHLPTEESIKPFKKQDEAPTNQTYQQLYNPSEFTINYPCRKSITGAFTNCGPKGFNGFCLNSNFFLAGEV